MKNIFNLIVIVSVLAIATIKGLSIQSNKVSRASTGENLEENIPCLGRIQILNGCGTEGAANAIAEYLRENRFDVKNIGNADSWNYPVTIVISRTKDTTIASKVAEILNVKNPILIRNEETLYDVTVIVGADYKERITNGKTKKKET
ncbi:MAG: LytR C-terminal domain-containing protein [Chitinispirillaceae bacterium]|nr:LytR C-terminal domain-containing protein [Chitinispirillaceae bacterium]